LTLDNEGIIEHLELLNKESKAIRQEALRFCWYMRGGLSYEDAMMLSTEERDLIVDIVKSNMETTKESGLPFF
jgi:hypothetical protein